MTSKEIIKRIIHHDAPPRLGMHFLEGNPADIKRMPSGKYTHPKYFKYSEFGEYPELLAKVSHFKGEVRVTYDGNIYGRLGGKTKGECVKGALQDGWELFDDYELPIIDEEFDKVLENRNYKECDKYMLTSLPFAVFSPLRDARLIDNALMDIILEPENICKFLDKITDFSLEVIRRVAKNGADGVIIYDDLGMQHALFFSPDMFRDIFKPYYKKLADEIHKNGMDFFLHSCGKVTDLIPDFIEVGVDVFQFDQPELHDSEFLAKEYGKKAAFYSPIDAQAIMPTGDRKIIEDGARKMVEAFKAVGGGLIVMDYGNWQDLNVEPEWQQWARDIVIANAEI